jgi:hypothetical protein
LPCPAHVGSISNYRKAKATRPSEVEASSSLSRALDDLHQHELDIGEG